MKRLAAVALALVVLTWSPLSGRSGAAHPQWVGTWMTSVIGRPPYPPAPATTTGPGGAPPAARMRVPHNETLRQIVHTTLGGDRVRVTFSNVFSAAPLAIGAAHIAVRAKDAGIAAGTDRTLMFGGGGSTTVPAGALVVSDPVSLAVPAFADLAIDLYLPESVEGQTMTVHRGALQTSYLSAGNHAGDADWPEATKINSWYFLQALEVAAPEHTAVVVAVGGFDHGWSRVDGRREQPLAGSPGAAARGAEQGREGGGAERRDRRQQSVERRDS